MSEFALLPSLDKKIETYVSASSMELCGINPLVRAAQALLLWMVVLKQTTHMEPHQVIILRQRLVHEILSFVQCAYNTHCAPHLILASRYCLCTALDEVILSTSWGNQSDWHCQTLLSMIQKETCGGERFFIILEEMARIPKENMPLLVLLYIILSLGFEGRYYKREQSVRDEIKQYLFRLIMIHHVEPDKCLSPSLKILQQESILIEPIFSVWKIMGITLALLFLLGVIFNVATYFTERYVLQEFIRISA